MAVAPPDGKFLLVGPDWNAQKPEGFGFAFHHLLLPALSLQRCVLLAPRRLMSRADINRSCGAFLSTNPTFELSLRPPQSPLPGNGFSPAETNEGKTAHPLG